MIICSSSNIDLIQGVSGYGTVADGATDWRIENTPTGVFNILNSPNLLAPNVSIIDVGNVGIGTIPITGTNKLQVQGAASVSGLITANTLTTSGLITANAGITVNTGSLTCANDTISKTYTATNTTAGANDILTMRYDTRNGIRFIQTLIASNDVRYDLIQKTNNNDYTAPVISFYKGNVGIGTNNPSTSYKLNVDGNVNISGGYFVGGSAFTIPYFNLTNKITAGNGISLTSGSASTSPSISTNLTAGNGISISAVASPVISTNLTAGTGISISAAASPTISANISAGSGITFTPSGNNISISAGASSQWTGATGANIYYNDGNVGIGTNNPSSMLTVTPLAGPTSVNLLDFKGNTGYGIYVTTKEIVNSGNTLYFKARDYNGGSVITRDVLTILPTGNVGIGTNDTGSYKLNVDGDINISGDYRIGGNSLSYNNLTNKLIAGNGISISANTSPVISTNQWITTGVNIYYNGGNVGIGTNNPSKLLHIMHDSDSLVRIETNTNAVDQKSGIEFGIPAYNTNTRSKIISQTGSGDISNLQFYTSNGNSLSKCNMTISSKGNVYIGGYHNSSYLFEVGTYSVPETITGSYLILSGSYYNSTGTYNNICCKINGALWATDYVVVSSDSRIKEDIQDINDDTALQNILAIQPKTYKYIDKLKKGNNKVYGFIAQQIKEVIPEAVKIENAYIPNIYLVANYIDCVITLQSQPIKVIIKVNDKIKCYDKDNSEILVVVIEVIDEITFRINNLEKEYIDTTIFVYGTLIDNFHALNKDYIFTLNVCATQELHRRIEAQNVLIKTQDDRIKGLEAKVEILLNNSRT